MFDGMLSYGKQNDRNMRDISDMLYLDGPNWNSLLVVILEFPIKY